MELLLVLLLVFVIVALVATIFRGPRQEAGIPVQAQGEPIRSVLVREHPVLPWCVGLSVAVLPAFFGLQVWVGLALGVVAGVGTAIVLHFLAQRRMARFEYQLADAIDLIVSALRAGGGLTDSLAGAAQEARRPLRGYLQELLQRLRLGEEPEQVLASIERRVSLESFRLFAMTLAAHWQGGGSLATTLSNVGRTIRDRVDVARRVRSQAIESQVSVSFVLLVTYGLAGFMWTTYPERFEAFAFSELGSMFVALSIFLQGIGLLWISRMTRIDV